jgi:hypothetical protein
MDKSYSALNYEPENSLTVSGSIKTVGGKPIPNGKIMLYSVKGGWFKLDTLADENGKFTFKRLVTDQDTTIKYIVQGRTSTNGKNVVVTLDTIAPFKSWKNKDIADGQLSDTTLLTLYQKQITKQLKVNLDKRTIQLKEVVIKEQKAPLSGVINPDQTIRDFPKEGTGETLSQFLATRARGVVFSNNKAYSTRAITGTAGGSPRPMQVMLDGAYIDYDVFLALNLTDIEGAEIMRTKSTNALYGTERSGSGMLILTSRKHTGYTRPSTPDVITYQSNGFYKAREFYSPKYEATSVTRQPDLRTTIYWKPDIVTDKDGNASLSFFNADTKGTYRITVEGIDTDGNIGHQVFTYKVE